MTSRSSGRVVTSAVLVALLVATACSSDDAASDLDAVEDRTARTQPDEPDGTSTDTTGTDPATGDAAGRPADEPPRGAAGRPLLRPQDVAAREMVERCEAYLREPPPEDWTGAVRLTRKR